MLTHASSTPWAEQYDLGREMVTLLLPLAGRAWVSPLMRDYLDRQTWDHRYCPNSVLLG